MAEQPALVAGIDCFSAVENGCDRGLFLEIGVQWLLCFDFWIIQILLSFLSKSVSTALPLFSRGDCIVYKCLLPTGLQGLIFALVV